MQKTRKKVFSLFTIFLVCCINIYAQQKIVKGTITDTGGETLPGVTVYVKDNKTIGTVTDIDGKYSLSVPATAKTLEASYVGMKTTEAAIIGVEINFVLEESISSLDEVVVIGYGTVKKKDLTGSVSSVQGSALQAVPVSNVAEAISGRLAGVQVTATEGSPDAELKIRVRGGGSITQDNAPLLIVDGFPVRSISDIPSSDIESIDVLKDASSTAIYGSRGANGVIIVTTKSSKEGKMSVAYNAFFGVKKIAKTLDVLSVPDYLKWQYELASLKKPDDISGYEKYFGSYQDMDLYNNVKGNNWQDLVYGRVGHVFNHNVNISGGSDKTTYSFNYAHIYDKAIMVGSDYTRDNLSLKLSHKPSKQVALNYSIRYSNTDINGGGLNEQNEKSSADSRLKHTIIYTPLPLNSMSSAAGNDDDEAASLLVNPFIAIQDSERKQGRRGLNMAGSASWIPIENLTLKTEFGYDTYDAEDNRFYGLSTYFVRNIGINDYKNKPGITLEGTTTKTFRNTNTLNYDFKKILNNKNHSLSLLLGQESITIKSKLMTNTVLAFPVDFKADDAFLYTGLGTPLSVNDYYSPDDKLFSFFGRANYNFMDKYLLSATFRADGSSKFATGNKWGYFPSAAIAWRVSSENFMEGTKNWLDDLKLRLSYGTAGNNNIPSGKIVQPLDVISTTWLDGFTNYISPSKTMANSKLKWETTYTRNIGVDYTLFNSKLSGSIELYLNNTKNLLIAFPTSGVGYDDQYRNMGETENRGLEVQFNYAAIDTKKFGLDLNFNIGFNKNKIKDLGVMNDFGASTNWASTDIINDYWVSVGGSVGEMKGYKVAGRYEVSDFTGYNTSTKKWELKEDVYDSSPVIGGNVRPGSMKLESGEQSIIGNANPLHTGGFGINARLYSFDLSAAFSWSYGNDVYNANKIEYTSTAKYDYRNMITEMADGKRWTNLLPNGTISNDMDELAELNKNTTMWSPYMTKNVFTDWAVEDGSFLRLNTLTLGYTLPNALTNKFLVKNLRLYATASNVFCWTNYSGFDPEVSTRRRTALTPGVDYSAYPKSRQFIFGINLNF